MNDTMTKEMEIYNSLTEKFNPLTVQSKPKKKHYVYEGRQKEEKKKHNKKWLYQIKANIIF